MKTQREHLAIVGVPSSAGAYAPGQERAPAALRAAGLLDRLHDRGIGVRDYGDTPSFRWRPDRGNPRAMNAGAVAASAEAATALVAQALATNDTLLVLGGDCTVELGTVAGTLAARGHERVGLVYVDLDTDLNTPESTTDGALDWMGVAHLLAIDGTLPLLASLGPRTPLLQPSQLLYFASDNVEPFERQTIERLGIAHVSLDEVAGDPAKAAARVAGGWARQFDRLLVHLDLDVLDFGKAPLAENTRRNVGLELPQLMAALRELLRASNWTALTICELNPDHGEADGSTLCGFVDQLAAAVAADSRE